MNKAFLFCAAIALFCFLETIVCTKISILNKSEGTKKPNIKFRLNPITGFSFAFAGYDIREASSKSFDQAVKYPIFAISYDQHQTFQAPNSTTVYDVPDQFIVYSIPTTNVVTNTDLFHSMEQILQEETTSFQFGLGFNLGKYGVEAFYNQTSGYIHFLYNETTVYSAQGFLTSTSTKFALAPPVLLPLHPYFQQIVSKIPQCPTSDQDLKMVDMFIQAYGHMFANELEMGGKFVTITSVNDNLLQKYDKTWIYQQLSLKFTYDGFSIYPGGFKNKTDIHISDDFIQASKTTMFFEGGDRKLQTNDTIKEWFQSIDDFPSIVGASFSPLSDLMMDDPVKQKNLEYIIQNHIDTGKVNAPPCASAHLVNQHQFFEIPGTSFIGSGFDSLTMTPKGFLVQHQFSEQTWTNPFYPSYSYSVPDTLTVFDNPESVEQNETYVSMSQSEIEDQVKQSVSGSYFFGLGHYSSDIYVYQYYHEVHNKFQVTYRRMINWYDLELSPLVQVDLQSYLHPWAKPFFNNLGSNINDPQVRAHYVKLLQTFGDSMIVKVKMGGALHYKLYMSEDLLKSVTIEDIHESSGFSFFGLFGGKKNYNLFSNSTNASVKEDAHAEIKIEGGVGFLDNQPGLQKTTSGYYGFNLKDINQSLGDWDSFVTTIKDNMAPTQYGIVPIYMLIQDPQIRDNMKQVTLDWINARLNPKK